MSEPKKVTKHELVKMYCETQLAEEATILVVLEDRERSLHPKGWMLHECAMLDSSMAGARTLICYGERCTFKDIPKTSFSPRGLASDMGSVIAYCEVK